MAEPEHDRIVVKSSFEEEICADRAELDLVISGSSFFSGRVALERAKEVREVVGILTQHGVAAADISLRDIVAESNKGMITDSSSARYTLRVVCRQLDRFADVLVEATRPKHTRLQQTVWKYPDDEELENSRLAAAMRRAKAKGVVVAEALGVSIEGVHLADFDVVDDDPGMPMAMAADDFTVRRKVSASETLGMSVEQTKRVGVRVRVEFRVGRSL